MVPVCILSTNPLENSLPTSEVLNKYKNLHQYFLLNDKDILPLTKVFFEIVLLNQRLIKTLSDSGYNNYRVLPTASTIMTNVIKSLTRKSQNIWKNISFIYGFRKFSSTLDFPLFVIYCGQKSYNSKENYTFGVEIFKRFERL